MDKITNARNGIRKAAIRTVSAAAMMLMNIQYLYCDTFEAAGTAAGNLFSKLKGLADKIFPLALVVTAICMFFTRDDKKFAMERKILIGICAAYLILQIVAIGSGSDISQTIQNLIGGG